MKSWPAVPARPNSQRSYERSMMGLAIPSNAEIDIAARALEDRGYRFLIDFGTDNAVWMADDYAPSWNYNGEREGAD